MEGRAPVRHVPVEGGRPPIAANTASTTRLQRGARNANASGADWPTPEESGRCPEHESPLEIVEETNWFFRLSRHAGAVREAIESGRLRVVHDGAREETLAFLRGARTGSGTWRAGSSRSWRR